MTNPDKRTGGVVVAALFAAAASTIVQAVRLPPVLSGADLDVLQGREPDLHVLSGALWMQAAHACGMSAHCVDALNAAAFAALLFAFAMVCGVSLLVAVPPKAAAFGALTFGLLAGLSPLAAVLLASPLGAEFTLSLALFALAAVDLAGVCEIAPWARCCVAAALVFADPFLAPVALAYGALGGPSRRRGESAIVFGCAAGACLIRVLLRSPSAGEIAGAHLDSLAGPLSIAVLGVGTCFIGPLVVYAVRVYARSGEPAARPLRVLTLGTLAALGGLFSSSGDPSAYLICGQTAFVIVVLMIVRVSRMPLRAGSVAVSLAVLQIVALTPIHRHIPYVVIVKASAQVQDAVREDARSGMRTCVAARDEAMAHLLVPGFSLRPALEVRTIDRCPVAWADTTRLITVDALHVEDWGVAALNLVRAAKSAKTATFAFPINDGSVRPVLRLRGTPTHAGAFGQTIPSAIGAVPAFTVLGGFTYRFSCVNVVSGSRLNFGVAQTLGSRPAQYEVSMSAAGRQYVLARATLAAPAALDLGWRYRSVRVPVTSSCALFRFSAPYPMPNTGIWMTFAGTAITAVYRNGDEHRKRA